MYDLLEERKKVLDTLQRVIETSEKYSAGLRNMEQRGFTQEGMLSKVIEISAIQSQQIRALARVAFFYASSSQFTSQLASAMVIQHEMDKEQEDNL